MTDSSYGIQNLPVSSGSLTHDSFNSNSFERYGNLLHQSFIKKFRGELIQLFNYVYGVSPRYTFIHHLMDVIRILQFLCPSLLVSYIQFWEKGSVQQITVDVISFFYTFLLD